jgi:hypothetical protein
MDRSYVSRIINGQWHHREMNGLQLMGNPADRRAFAQTQTKVTSRLSRVFDDFTTEKL